LRKAQLDQVRYRGEVADDVERSHMRMLLRLDGNSDRTH